MATAVAGIWGRGGRLGTSGGYALLRVCPRIAYELGARSARATTRCATWSCTNQERTSRLFEKESSREVQKHVSRGNKIDFRGPRSLTIQAIVRGRGQQARCLAAQSSKNGKIPEKQTYASPLLLQPHIQLIPHLQLHPPPASQPPSPPRKHLHPPQFPNNHPPPLRPPDWLPPPPSVLPLRPRALHLCRRHRSRRRVDCAAIQFRHRCRHSARSHGG